MRRGPAVALVLALVAAGCLGAGGDGDAPAGYATDNETSSRGPGGTPATPPPVLAPWWEEGRWWQVEFTTGGTTSSFKLVHFLNDSDTEHFWVGLADRDAVVDHALHDTNPLLGRVHWGYLSPHESGTHASAMYTFPVAPGDRWKGHLWARDWQLLAEAGDQAGSLVIRGQANDGATLTYDYDPDAEWFTSLVVVGGDGNEEARLEVVDHGVGATGTFYFIRGRDNYAGPSGELEDTFDVCTGPDGSGEPCMETKAVDALAVEIDAVWSQPGRLEVIDPAGNVVHEETQLQGSVERLVELAEPAPGTWKVRYIGGVPEGSVTATGFLEYAGTL